MPTVHRVHYVCAKADQVHHPDRETRHQLLRRHLYAISSLLAVRQQLAALCPDVAAGRSRERLVIREGEFTVDHRPVSLRILLAECHACPDPEPPEPTVHPDPTTAEIIHAATTTALGRLRWLGDTNGHIEAVLDEFDTAVAAALDIAPDAVPDLTGTHPQPTIEQAEFERLLDGVDTGPLHGAVTRRDMARTVIRTTLQDLDSGDRQRIEHARRRLRKLPASVSTNIRPMLLQLIALMDDDPAPGTAP